MHSDKYETVKKYYYESVWDEHKLRNAVSKKWITESEFIEITGSDY